MKRKIADTISFVAIGFVAAMLIYARSVVNEAKQIEKSLQEKYTAHEQIQAQVTRNTLELESISTKLNRVAPEDVLKAVKELETKIK